MKTADFVIIGSGQGGVPLAAKLAKNGRDVVLFERSVWGGTCVNTGCIPSKTLLASVHAAAAASNAQTLGIHSSEVNVDFGAVMKRVQDAIRPAGIAKWLDDAGVQLVEAEAEFIGAQWAGRHAGIHLGLGKAGFVAFIVPVAPVAYQIDQKIFLKFLPINAGQPGGFNTGFGIIGVDVDDGDFEPFGQIAGVQRTVSGMGISGKPQLVIGNDVDDATYAVTRQSVHIQCFGNNTLCGKCGIAVN
jgi:hypothetical protein